MRFLLICSAPLFLLAFVAERPIVDPWFGAPGPAKVDYIPPVDSLRLPVNPWGL